MTNDAAVPKLERLWTTRREGEVLGAWLAVIAEGTPDLRGAACRGRAPEFDYDDPADPRAAPALALCADCPVLQACAAWLESLPDAAQPTGVVAGRIVPPLPERQRAARRRARAADTAAAAETVPNTPSRPERPRQPQTAGTTQLKEITA